MAQVNLNYQVIEGVVRGAGRKFSDAKRLNLIDRHILPLINGLNALHGIETLACCEGHGFLGRYSAPYVAFTAPTDIAFRFQIALDAANVSLTKPLSYYWNMDARYSVDGVLVYRLYAPTLDRHFWVTRRKLNSDFQNILKLFQVIHT